MSEAKKTLAIIDGKSVFYRGYYAMPYLSMKDGTPTGGVFGFAVLALEIIKRLKPDYVCVAWDKPKTNIRSRLKLYPQYKANRKPAPPDFYAQIPILHELLEAFGWPLYEFDDYEADDIMGTLAKKATAAGLKTELITSDLDMLQLIDEDVKVFTLKKGLSNVERLNPSTFEDKYGISVEQFIDLKALKGDSSDNIPGVAGIGEKTAVELLKQYETLDGIYENIELIKETVKKKLVAGKDMAYTSKQLVTIMTDAPMKLDLPAMDVNQLDTAELAHLLRKLEFKSLLRQLPEAMQSEVPAQPEIAGTVLSVGKSTIVSDSKGLQSMKLSGDTLFVHTRCAGAHGRNPQVMLLATDHDNVYVLDLTELTPKDVAKHVPQLSDPKIKKVGYDIKADIKCAMSLGIELTPVSHDVLVGAFLINSLRREVTLTELAESDLGYEGAPFENLDTEDFMTRGAEFVSVIDALYRQQSEQLDALPSIAKVGTDIEWPTIAVLAKMEYRGIALDTKQLKVLNAKLSDSISDLEQEIYGYADQEFNISSPSQLADILFVKLNLPTDGVKKGKTGSYSTAAKELDRLKDLHPIIGKISQYREVTKLKNTYVETLPKQVDENSRLHTTYNLATAQTGRLSSVDPNLQNIPIRTELGREIRRAFVAGKGNVFVSADYSQFELRLAAYLAGDKELMKIFNDGTDVHTATAAQVFGISEDKVDAEHRRAAKVVNFGIIYGMSPHGLSVASGMTLMEAKQFIDKYFELRKPLLDYMNKLKKQAKEDGYVETLFGRRRPTPDVHSSNFIVRSAAERAAINMPIQGTEADLMKMAMVELEAKLDDDCELLLQVHDSFLVECPKEKAAQVEKLMRDTMEHVYELPVTLDVDVHTGKDWGDL